MKRVMCLYRVSTKGQVDNKDDIPMQRRECKAFIERQDDWVFYDERMEKGISGYKVSAANRDAIIEIREMAERKQFDVLLVFMFDRLGRKEDETPFLVKWFIDHGIEVWSTREGQQKLDNQVDRLLNFMRYWAASGESEKTSIRVKAAQTQMTQDGIWRGGNCPFGYKLVHNGRIGKKNRPLYDLMIDEVNGPIVSEIFDLVTNQGIGTLKIANLLNSKYPNPKKIWTKQTILAMLRNPVYTGRLHMNDTQSEPVEELRIISDSQFEFVNQALKRRVITRNRELPCGVIDEADDDQSLASQYKATLLSGILYCAHCGHKLVGSWTTRTNKTRKHRYPCYRCYYGSVKAKECDGMTHYRSKPIENAVLFHVRKYFATINSAVDDEWKAQARKQLRDNAKARQKAAEARLGKLQTNQSKLKAEIMKAINGESAFDTDLLKEMMEENKRSQTEAEAEIDSCREEADREEKRISEMAEKYREIRDWSEMFDSASMEMKKMILARLIERVTVDRDYNIEIHYYVTPEDYVGDAGAVMVTAV